MEYTTLNKEDTNAIVAQYGLGEVHSSKVLSGGSENTNYHITIGDRAYVLTLCENKSLQEATILAQLLEHLGSHGFSTSKVIKTLENKPVALYVDKPVLLKTFINGKIIPVLPNHLLQLAGQRLGRLHNIEAPDFLPTEISFGKQHFNDVSIYAPNSTFHLWLEKITAYLKPYFELNLPKTLIHSDLFSSNIIVSDSEEYITIMDFEEAAYYDRIFDIGMAFTGLCSTVGNLDLEKAKWFLNGYGQEVELTDLEQGSLQAYTVYAAAAMAFWRHKNFNYTHPIVELKDHYKELQQVADMVKGMFASAFKKILS